MKRLYQFFILFLLITAIGCDDSPVKVLDIPDVEPTSTNIHFVPDTLILNNANSKHLITFFGINFNKHTPDSIIIDNTKFEFQTNDTLLHLSVMAIRAGFHEINIYFPSGLITLEKKIYVLYDDDVLPNEKSIYFTPDSVYVNIGSGFNTIYLQGTSFKQHKIDSAFVGKEKCQLGGMGISMLPIYTTTSLSGSYPVILYYKGNKIELQKKLTIINPIVDFDILAFSEFSYFINNVPIMVRSDGSEHGASFSHQFDWSNYPRKFDNNIYEIQGYRFTLYIEFDKEYRVIKKLTSGYYDEKEDGRKMIIKSYKVELNNLPFKINYYEDNKIELAIELMGTIINDYEPLTQYSLSSRYGNTETITLKDSITGKRRNYFPTTEASVVKYYLRNYK
jgi:hypothetical protein